MRLSSLKKFGVALAACSALGAVLASIAVAGTSVTEPAAWVKTESGVPKTIVEEEVVCRRTVAEKEGNFVFRSKVLGQPLEITATGINCTGGKVRNTGTPSTSMALFEGQLEFTGVSVDSPVGCKIASTNKTNPLIGDLKMEENVNTKSFLEVSPASGTVITTFVLTNCAAAGNYQLKGFFDLEATTSTGTHAQNQLFAGNATTCEMSALLLGKEPATLTGEFEIELKSGSSWGAEHP